MQRIPSKHVLVRFLNDNFIWILLLLMMTGATIANTRFLSVQNMSNILMAAAPLGCLVLAEAIVLLTGNFDLSIESNMIFVAIVGGVVMAQPAGIGGELTGGGMGLAWPLALVIMLGLSSLVGLVNGLMVAKLKMNNFMVTLGALIVLEGLALVVGEGRNLFGIPEGFRFVGQTRIGKIPVAAIFLLVLFLLARFLLNRMVFGRQLYAVGSNREAARAAGIDDEKVIIGAYVICGFLTGLAAYVLVGRLGTASAGISDNALFFAFAAAVVGGVSLYGGRGSAMGALGGLFLIVVIQNAMNMAQVEANYVKVVLGTTIIFAVFIDTVRSRGTS